MPFKSSVMFLLVLPLLAASQDYYDGEYLRYRDYIYKPNIQTVLFHKKDVVNSQPILELDNNASRLLLSFDDLNGNFKDMQYTIIHCDANWQPSNLYPNDYIQGMSVDYITRHKTSFNTYVPYTHYWLEFPSPYMKPKISGNYVLKVFIANDEENVVLTRRFFVVEQEVQIVGEVKQATYAKYRPSKHEIDFSVNFGNLPVTDAFREIKVVLRQNDRWDNVITDLRPQFVQDQTLIYDFEEENLFFAVNEFRVFDIRSVRYNKQNVGKIYLDSVYHAMLYTDEDRSYLTYTDRIDINGNRIITLDRGEASYEGDYMVVHFNLKNALSLAPDEEVYLFGALTDWRIQDRYKLEYNSKTKSYQLSTRLKQGYYNYMYAVVKPGMDRYDLTYLEGSHFETENNYSLYVYYLDPFIRAHRLVGLTRLNSEVDQ